jgi:peptidoglycan/xylan/chitin deacetylase (PgdA/CDA1 family)
VRPRTAVLPAAVLAQLAPGATRSAVVRSRMPRLNGDGDVAHVALTFDDGPDPESTPAFLRCLAQLDVHATFFLLGRMVERSPDLARELVDRGHEVAVHGWDHRSLALRGPVSTWAQVRDGAAVVQERTGEDPRWWRPPYGVLTAAGLVSARRAGLTPVLWGAWGEDWTAHASPDSVTASLARGLRPGSTVLLHDSSCTSAPGSWRSALGALPGLVRRCRDRGLDVGPLREHRLGRC